MMLLLLVLCLGNSKCDDQNSAIPPHEHAAEKAAETLKDAKDGSESWAEWAKDKLFEGFGFGAAKAKDAAKQTKEKLTHTASGI